MNKKWLLVGVVYLTGIIVVFNQYKVPPVLTELMQTFTVNATDAGWFMAVFALIGVFLSLPAAVFLRRVGPRGSGTIGLACVLYGCLIGGIAVSAAALLTGRMLEGIGFCIVSVAAPTVIAMYFGPEEIGLPMGIWATSYPVGSALAYYLSRPMTAFFGGWRGSWWIGLMMAFVAMVVYFLVVKKPAQGILWHNPLVDRPIGRASLSFAVSGLKNIKIWLLGASFLFMMIGSLGYLAWAPAFFVDMFGLSKSTANAYVGIGFLWSAPGGLFAGWLLTKTGRRNALLVGCAFVSLLLYPCGFFVPATILTQYLACVGFVTGFTYALVLAMVPMVMPNRAFTGIGMGVIVFMQSMASFVAMPLFGKFTAGGVWSAAALPSVAILSMGLIFAVLLQQVPPNGSLRDSFGLAVKES